MEVRIHTTTSQFSEPLALMNKRIETGMAGLLRLPSSPRCDRRSGGPVCLLKRAAGGLIVTLCLSGPLASIGQAQDSADAPETQTVTREITILPGDTLSHIALREMGSASEAVRLATANGLTLSKILRPGDTLQVPVTLPVRNEFATVIFAKGDVTLNGDSLEIDDEVRLNDRVETGTTGYASLVFSTGTLINLQPNTIARLVALHCQTGDELCVIEMAADKGALTSDVRRDGSQQTDFRVTTPYASAAVRGTRFDVDADDTGLRIGVTEGNVELAAANSDARLSLDLGFGSVTAPGGSLGQPIDLLPAPVFRFVPPRIALGDSLRWFGLTDTPEYTVQIAASPNGVGIASDERVTSDLFLLNEVIPAGDYNVVVRAVDSNGLLGFTAQSPITIAAIDDALPAVETSISRDSGDYLIEVVGAPQNTSGFEIQIATDENFSDPLSVDVDSSGVSRMRIASDVIFARTRILIDRTTVGPFGETSTVN